MDKHKAEIKKKRQLGISWRKLLQYSWKDKRLTDKMINREGMIQLYNAKSISEAPITGSKNFRS